MGRSEPAFLHQSPSLAQRADEYSKVGKPFLLRSPILGGMKSTHLLNIVIAGGIATGSAIATEPGSGLGGRRGELKQWRQQMETQMKQQDAELEKLQQQIDSASGPQQKVDALSAAVKALIQQRKTMHEQFESIRERIQGGESNTQGGATLPGGASSPGATTTPGGTP